MNERTLYLEDLLSAFCSKSNNGRVSQIIISVYENGKWEEKIIDPFGNGKKYLHYIVEYFQVIKVENRATPGLYISIKRG